MISKKVQFPSGEAIHGNILQQSDPAVPDQVILWRKIGDMWERIHRDLRVAVTNDGEVSSP
jgi:hypothetical protein